jgi:protein O-mannosyl-transferase
MPRDGRTDARRAEPGVVAALLIAVAVAVAWVQWPVLDSTSIWLDDEGYVTANPLVLNPSWESAARFLSEVRHPSTVGGYYQPLTMISLMLDSAAGGGAERLRPYHYTSLALHILNTLLIIAVLIELFGAPLPAALVGLLFGLHPLTVEPLAWLSERKTLLAACFASASLAAYVRYTRGRASAWLWYAAALVGYVLALLSKPTSTPLPLLFLLLDYWPLRRLNRSALIEKIPFVALGLAAAVVTVLSQQQAGQIESPAEQSVRVMLLTVCHNLVFYLWKMIWPAQLAGYYLYPDPMTLGSQVVLAGVVGTALLAGLIGLSLPRTRAPLVAGLFFAVALFPTMGVVRFTTPIASEKYAYLPSFGVLLLLAWLLARVWTWAQGAGTRGRVAQASVCAVMLALAAAESRTTRRYLAVWHDDESHYGYVLERVPDAWWLQYDFGDVLARQGRMQEALAHYRQAEAGDAEDVDVQYKLGNALFSLGRADEAIIHYRKGLAQQPANAALLYNLALAEAQSGRPDTAVATLRDVLRLQPSHAQANNQLGVALARQGQIEDAVAHYRAAVQSEDDFFAARVNLADALHAIGRGDEAIAQYRAALGLDPNDAAVHTHLGVALAERGQLDDAIEQFQTALRLDPDSPDAQTKLRNAVVRRALHE